MTPAPSIIAEAVTAARASLLAYSTRAEYLDGYGLSTIRVQANHEYHVWLPPPGSDLPGHLAHRGTTDRADWRTDIDRDLVPPTFYHTGKVRVHQGGRDALAALATDLQIDLPQAKTWYVEGHSLGGLLTLLLAAQLPSHRLAGVHTFGCPRPGNAEFARQYQHADRTYNWIIPGDPIPHLAPALPGRYRHIDCQYRLERDLTVTVRPSYWSRLRALITDPRKLDDYHKMSLYLDRLETLLALHTTTTHQHPQPITHHPSKRT